MRHISLYYYLLLRDEIFDDYLYFCIDLFDKHEFTDTFDLDRGL